MKNITKSVLGASVAVMRKVCEEARKSKGVKEEDKFCNLSHSLDEDDDWNRAMAVIHNFFNDDMVPLEELIDELSETAPVRDVAQEERPIESKVDKLDAAINKHQEMLTRRAAKSPTGHQEKITSSWSYLAAAQSSDAPEVPSCSSTSKPSSLDKSASAMSASLADGSEQVASDAIPRSSSRVSNPVRDNFSSSSISHRAKESLSGERPIIINGRDENCRPLSLTELREKIIREKLARKDSAVDRVTPKHFPFAPADVHHVVRVETGSQGDELMWIAEFLSEHKEEKLTKNPYGNALTNFRAKLEKSSFDPSSQPERSLASELATQGNTLAFFDQAEGLEHCRKPFFPASGCCVMEELEAVKHDGMPSHDDLEESLSGDRIALVWKNELMRRVAQKKPQLHCSGPAASSADDPWISRTSPSDQSSCRPDVEGESDMDADSTHDWRHRVVEYDSTHPDPKDGTRARPPEDREVAKGPVSGFPLFDSPSRNIYRDAVPQCTTTSVHTTMI